MEFFRKLERKYGRYAIHNLMYYIIILYGIGMVIQWVDPMFYIRYLSLDASAILRGQIWRIVTFVIWPPSTDIFLIFCPCISTTGWARTWRGSGERFGLTYTF